MAVEATGQAGTLGLVAHHLDAERLRGAGQIGFELVMLERDVHVREHIKGRSAKTKPAGPRACPPAAPAARAARSAARACASSSLARADFAAGTSPRSR